MEGICASMNAHPSIYPGFDFNDTCDTITVSETKSDAQPYRHPVKLEKRTISDGFAQSPLSTKDGFDNIKSVGDNGSLRLVWVRLHKDSIPWKLDINEKDLDSVLDTFNLRSAYKYAFTSAGGITFMPVRADERPHTIVCAVFMPDLFGIAWNHNLTTHQTSAVCWGDEWILKALQDIISYQVSLSHHPMFPALLAAIMLGRLLDRDLHRDAHRIEEVENRTRYHPRQNTAAGTAEGSYASLSAKMSGCAAAFAGLERIAGVLHVILDAISAYRQPQRRMETDEKVEHISAAVRKCVGLLRDRLKMEEAQIKFLTRRVEVQLTAIFNLISQKASRISTAVAEDSRTLASASKEDSSAMKMLAAVTVAFLPGTFVAALFSMPLFQWDVDVTSSIVSSHFWIYWAVTVPLTVVTLVAWIAWTRVVSKRHWRLNRAGRETLWAEIDGTSAGKDVYKESHVTEHDTKGPNFA